MVLKEAKEQIKAKKSELRAAYLGMLKEMEDFRNSLLAAFLGENLLQVNTLLAEVEALKELPELKEEAEETYKRASAFSQVFFVEKAVTKAELGARYAQQVVPSIKKLIDKLEKLASILV